MDEERELELKIRNMEAQILILIQQTEKLQEALTELRIIREREYLKKRENEVPKRGRYY